MYERLRQHRLLEGLEERQIQALMESAEVIELAAGDCLCREGEPAEHVFYVVQGSAGVYKHDEEEGIEHKIDTLESGRVVGEMAFLSEDRTRKATVRAEEPCRVLRFQPGQWPQHPDLDHVVRRVSLNLARELARRLQHTNEVTVEALRKELQESRLRVFMGVAMTRIILITSVYTLALSYLLGMTTTEHINTTWVSVPLIVVFALLCFMTIRRSPFPLSTFGLTLKNAGKISLQAVLYSLPVLLLVLMAKLLVLHFAEGLPDTSVFTFTSSFKGDFSWKMWWGVALVYAMFCPVQEFIVRSAMQTSFESFLSGNPHAVRWSAIVLSNLVFAAAHSHISMGFAVAAFVPGLFWGWLFSKQQSLVGVSVSHALIGLWAVFVVGFNHLF